MTIVGSVLYSCISDKNDLQIIAIANPGDKEILNYYYIKSFKSKYDTKAIFIENINNQYVDDLLEKQNGTVFYLFKGDVINVFSYESLIN